jgi:hypothetical protein
VRRVEIDELLKVLRPYPYGWQVEIPAPYKFLGHSINLDVETRPNPDDVDAPVTNEIEIELARLILTNLSDVLGEAERRYVAYCSDEPGVLERIEHPRIWLCREFMSTDSKHWVLAAGFVDAPDWVVHAEFSGLFFEDIWSGD